jgi:ribonuclease-3
MSRLLSLHNKTQTVSIDDMPYNTKNILLQKEDLKELFEQHGLEGVEFRNINLYRTAFVHKSYCTMKNSDFEKGNEQLPVGCLPLQDMSYERLEFLGDSILAVVVSQYLFDRYPDQNEGFLSQMRTKIVNGKMLGSLSAKMGLSKFIIMSKQIEESNGRNNYKLAEDCFESLIAAIYLDFQTEDDTAVMPKRLASIVPMTGAGYHIAETWIVTIMEKYIDFVDLIQSRTNYKDMLSRWMQNTFQDAPRFFEVSVETRNNKSVFKYCVKDRANAVIGTATGMSKKDAENNAARAALTYYGQPT